MKPNFTIRIYGIYVKDGNVLLSREKYGEKEMLKFPGGGLEFGEGTIDCLRREWLEEFNLDVEVIGHFYTTDFFVKSAFHAHTQVMSIYYLIKVVTEPVPVNILFQQSNGEQMLAWYNIIDLSPDMLTFPIDQKVVEMIKGI